ncbi:MAG: signal peptidase I [Planctomycetes bacterium]|nr:signal peptidase I [Planctomycetota bacterium]
MAQNAQLEPAVALERNRNRVKAARRWIRRLRYGLGALLLLVGVYALMSYSVYTLPGEYDPNSTKVQSPIEDIQRGDTVLLLKLNLWRDPKVGDIVLYDHPNPRDGVPEVMLGRIAGAPGEEMRRAGPTMAIGGRPPLSVGFDIGSQATFQDGQVIPEGQYLILMDTDAVNYGDSRDFGLITRDAIRQKVALNMAGVLGQRAMK